MVTFLVFELGWSTIVLAVAVAGAVSVIERALGGDFGHETVVDAP